jgi:hypothetical protein
MAGEIIFQIVSVCGDVQLRIVDAGETVGVVISVGRDFAVLVGHRRPAHLSIGWQYVSNINSTPNSPRDFNKAGEKVGPPSKLDVKCPHQMYTSFSGRYEYI